IGSGLDLPAALLPLGLDHPIADRLGRGFELASQIGRVTPGTNQLDHLAPELRRIGRMRLGHKDTSRKSIVGVHQTGATSVTDKGYHSRAILQDLDGGVWKTRIAEPKQPGFSRWHGDDKARAAVYANRTRLGSGVGKQAMRLRAEIVERSFAHNLDRGGMRRTWLRGRENVHK